MTTVRKLSTIAAALLVAIPVLAAAGTTDPAPSPDLGYLEGEIVDVRDAMTETGAGPFTEVRVQTRERETFWVRLGRSDASQNAYRLGDRLRVRVMAGADGNDVRNALRVRNMTTGSTDRFRPVDGTALRERHRDRLQDGSRAGEPQRRRQRDRIHEPGTGGCTGDGTGRRGERGRR